MAFLFSVSRPGFGLKACKNASIMLYVISHFIAAREFMREENNLLSANNPKAIKQFLELSHWLRTRLLWLYTPNVKDNILFTEATLMPLPDWISSEGVVFYLDPFEEKLRDINAEIEKS